MAKKQDREEVLLIVVSDQTGRPLPDLRLELPDAANVVVAEGLTDANGQAFINVATTTLKELMAPDDKIKVRISEAGNYLATTYELVHWNSRREHWKAKIQLFAHEAKDVEVPFVVGLSVDDAELALLNVGLEPVVEEVETDEYAEGVVFDQYPEDGDWVEKGSEVNLMAAVAIGASPPTLPDGPEPTIEVPNFVGLRIWEARLLAQGQNIPVVFPLDRRDYDVITHQDPPPGKCQSPYASVAFEYASYYPELTRICGRLCACEAERDDCCDDKEEEDDRSRIVTALAGAEVCVYRAGTDEQCCCQDTTDDGTFCCTVPPGEWDVVFPQVDGYKLNTPGLERLRVRVAVGQTVDLAPVCYVARGGQVNGIVFLDRDQTGVPANNPRLDGRTITLRALADGQTQSYLSDGHGAYLFDNLRAGYYQLQAAANFQHGAFGALEISALPVAAFYVGPGSAQTLDIPYLLAGGEVEGRVFYDANGSGKQFGGEPGIDQVQVILVNQQTQAIQTVLTDADGDYLFTGVAPGQYRVVFSEMTSAVVGLTPRQTLSLSTSPEQTVDVVVGRRALIAPTGYGPERHTVSGSLMFKDGDQDHAAAGFLVYMTDGANNTYQTTTDRQGRYTYEFDDAPGEIKLTFYAPTEDNVINFENQPLGTTTVYVNKPVNAGINYLKMPLGGRGGMAGGLRSPGRGWAQSPGSPVLDEAVTDIAAYMPTSSDVGVGGGSGGYSTTPFPLQQAVDRAMTEVLGRKLQENDPTAFLAALGRSFTINDDEENRRIRWTPRLYAIHTELGGAITGAQASLYHRAKTAIDDALPLLDGLEPLQSAPDEEEVAAVRAIVRTEMAELVNELGLEGGPRVHRVDSILRLLRKEIKRMENVFGLDPKNVITVAEEEALTNYLVIRDYIDSLSQTWNNFRQQFLGVGSGFLGTQLVLLQRALSVIVESVDEAYRAMDSVNLGPNERQTVYVNVPGQDSITVEELLSWVTRFARDEAPALVLEGGRRGVGAIRPIATELAGLVGVAATANTGNVGFSRPRVRRALTELQAQLVHVDDLCKQLLP